MKQKLINWLRGRYGTDDLNRALLAVWVILAFLNIFIGSTVIYLISVTIALVTLFRMLSKNFAARRRENEFYLRHFAKYVNALKTKFGLLKRMFAERKTHRYIKCPKCRSILRVPYRKGTHTAVCPKCRERFEKTIR